jgi:hypothetical protein
LGFQSSPKYKFVDYENVSAISGVVISSKYATLHELQTVYGTEDMYNLYEVISVNNYNQNLLVKAD